MPVTSCLRCAEPVGARDRFCEACGIRVADYPTEGCVACAATNVGADGYCLRCGRLQPNQRDRMEVDVGTAAGVSDRGARRRRNEDALALRRL
ncbi:MAG: PP2C family serine/threonine-protein phosphatase, partial [Pseudonocardiaceae bacterium]